MRIKITSDSTCDLSREQIARYDIEIMPLAVAMGGNNYRDGVDIAPSDIYSHVDKGGDLPKTAASNIADYQAVFAKHLQTYDAVIHLNISSDFSSCYQNACLAAEEFENVHVIDSRNLSTGHGLLVLKAAELAEKYLKVLVKPLAFVGRHTLPIMCWHLLAIEVVKKIWHVLVLYI